MAVAIAPTIKPIIPCHRPRAASAMLSAPPHQPKAQAALPVPVLAHQIGPVGLFIAVDISRRDGFFPVRRRGDDAQISRVDDLIRRGRVDLTFPLQVMGETREVRFQSLEAGRTLAWSALTPCGRRGATVPVVVGVGRSGGTGGEPRRAPSRKRSSSSYSSPLQSPVRAYTAFARGFRARRRNGSLAFGGLRLGLLGGRSLVLALVHGRAAILAAARMLFSGRLGRFGCFARRRSLDRRRWSGVMLRFQATSPWKRRWWTSSAQISSSVIPFWPSPLLTHLS